MKKRRLVHRARGLLLAVAVLGMASAGHPARLQDTVLDRVQEAFVAGDARVLTDMAADRIEIGIRGSGKLYSRAQALYVMQDFFRDYPPEAFTLESESKTEGSWIAAGQYDFKHAEHPFQVYIRLRMKDTVWELREIRIEERLRE